MSNRNHFAARHDSTTLLPQSHAGYRQYESRSSHRWIIWLGTGGIFLPHTALGETGRYAVALFFFPAVVAFITGLLRGSRRLMACDIFVGALALWMVAVKIGSSADGALFFAASDAFALIASYMLARAFFYGPGPVKEFLKILKLVLVAVTTLSILDPVFGFPVVQKLIGQLAEFEQRHAFRHLLGFNIQRAQGSFAHPILFGSFCAAAAAILLNSEGSISRRVFYFGVCLIGCLLSVSSGPLLVFPILIVSFSFDWLLHSYPQRWKLLCTCLTLAVCALLVLSNNPIAWIFGHLIFNPESGSYRIIIWSNAFEYIAASPIVGFDPSAWSTNDILSDSIDCVWLVLSLYFGVPAVLLLLFANISACGLFGRKINNNSFDSEILHLRTAFSAALFTFMVVGLTVHFWGSIWMFWGLCVGTRASLEEYFRSAFHGPIARKNSSPMSRSNRYDIIAPARSGLNCPLS
jgi:hypothetical protein